MQFIKSNALYYKHRYYQNNPVDDVKWSGFLEAMQGGIELQKINIPDYMTIKEFADRISIITIIFKRYFHQYILVLTIIV